MSREILGMSEHSRRRKLLVSLPFNPGEEQRAIEKQRELEARALTDNLTRDQYQGLIGTNFSETGGDYERLFSNFNQKFK